METQAEYVVFLEDDPPGPRAAIARVLEMEDRARIRCVLLMCRRPNGALLHDLAVLRRVSGATLAMVRQERADVVRAGTLVEEIRPDPMIEEGKTL